VAALPVAAITFFAMHLFPSTRFRPAAIRALGEGAYLGLFSVISLVSLVWLTNAFWNAPYGEKLWAMPAAWLWLKAALILMALIFTMGGASTPNPSLPGGGKALLRGDLSQGIFAITRHPLMWGIGIWAMAHLISQGTVRGILFFGSFALTALAGAWLQDKRKLHSLGAGWAAFEKQTSFLPFAALIEGRAHLSLSALGWWRVGLAVILWAAVLHFHYQLFGVHPLPANV